MIPTRYTTRAVTGSATTTLMAWPSSRRFGSTMCPRAYWSAVARRSP
ncbi:hypothetical protein [Lysobacter gummosus]